MTAPPPAGENALKIAIGIEYHGAAFCGWQSQPNGAGAQDAIQTALSAVASAPVAVRAAGRTDAGAHATLMTAHFATPVRRQPSAWVAGGNANLPAAARLLWAKPAPANFHARHSAHRRRYQYVLQNRPAEPTLFAQLAGHCRAPLDFAAMREAAAHLPGERDFSAFRAAACQAKSPIRRLFSLRLRRAAEFIVFDFVGDGFLHHMARNIVGALVEIGRRRRPPAWTAELLAGRDRRLAAPTAPAAGLYFCGASYAPHFALPEDYRPSPLVAAADDAHWKSV